MPIYEYKCLSCGKRFEALQKFSDEPLAIHAECGGPAEKLISSPSFHFKGTGWYVTDYAKGNGTSKPDGKPADSKAEKAESGGGSTGSESKSAESKPAESKPAAATPTSDTK